MVMRNAVITRDLNIEKENGSLNLFSLIIEDAGILECSSPLHCLPLPLPDFFPPPSPLSSFPLLILIFIV